MQYIAAEKRYERMKYNRCGESGVELPAISLGLWHNFGGVDVFEECREILHRAFDYGITHFDLANNYGPPPGSAEETFGQVLSKDFTPYRDELFISTKAGYLMWPGPYGEWGSKKNLMASLDQSLERMGLEYVDLFYSHRPDPKTPLDETMEALVQAVRQGKALYVGISNYSAEDTRKAARILAEERIHCLIHQPRYSMFDRWIEDGLLDVLEAEGMGCIPFSPLAQGLLTNRYLDGIPHDSRAAKSHGFLDRDEITEKKMTKIRALNEVARDRDQSLAQLALCWVLRDSRITSVLVGVSRLEQLHDDLKILESLDFEQSELDRIEGILKTST